MTPEDTQIVTVLDLRKTYQAILTAWKKAENPPDTTNTTTTLGAIKKVQLDDGSNAKVEDILKLYPIINMDSAIALFSRDETECDDIARKTYQEQKEWLKTRLNSPQSSEVAAEALSNESKDLKDISVQLEECTKQLNSQASEQDKANTVKTQLQNIQKLVKAGTLTDANDAKTAIDEALEALGGEQKSVEVQSLQPAAALDTKAVGNSIAKAQTAINTLLAKAEAKAKADAEQQAADNKKLISLLEEGRKTKLVLKNEEKDGVKENVDAFIACIFQRTNQGLIDKLKADVKTYKKKSKFYVHTVIDGANRTEKKKALGELIKELEEGKFSRIILKDSLGNDIPGFLYCSYRQGAEKENGKENGLEFVLAYQDIDGLKAYLQKIKETMEEVPGAGRVMNFHTEDDMAEKIAWALENGIKCEFDNQPCFFQKALDKIDKCLANATNTKNTTNTVVNAILHGIKGSRVSWIGSWVMNHTLRAFFGTEKNINLSIEANQKFFMKHYFRSEKGQAVKKALFEELLSIQNKSSSNDVIKSGLAMEKLLIKTGEPLISDYKTFLKNKGIGTLTDWIRNGSPKGQLQPTNTVN